MSRQGQNHLYRVGLDQNQGPFSCLQSAILWQDAHSIVSHHKAWLAEEECFLPDHLTVSLSHRSW